MMGFCCNVFFDRIADVELCCLGGCPPSSDHGAIQLTVLQKEMCGSSTVLEPVKVPTADALTMTTVSLEVVGCTDFVSGSTTMLRELCFMKGEIHLANFEQVPCAKHRMELQQQRNSETSVMQADGITRKCCQ